MPVGNASSPIKFSELQSFYGGSNPISLSEYYRGGSEVPTTVDTTQSVNATYSGGTKGAGAGGGGYAHNPNFESSALSITFPANTVVSAAVPWSWSTTNVVYGFPTRSQDDEPYGWGNVVYDASLTIGGQTYTNVNKSSQPQGGQSFFASNTGVAGVRGNHRLYYRVSAGSGLSFSGYSVYDGPGSPGSLPTSNSQSLLNDAGSVGILYNLQPGAANYQPQSSDSQHTAPGADNSASGSFTITGTTGSSGCTLKMFLGEIIGNAQRVGWSPQSLGTRSGTQTVQGDTNVGVPTSGVLDLNDFRTLTNPSAG